MVNQRIACHIAGVAWAAATDDPDVSREKAANGATPHNAPLHAPRPPEP